MVDPGFTLQGSPAQRYLASDASAFMTDRFAPLLLRVSLLLRGILGTQWYAATWARISRSPRPWQKPSHHRRAIACALRVEIGSPPSPMVRTAPCHAQPGTNRIHRPPLELTARRSKGGRGEANPASSVDALVQRTRKPDRESTDQHCV